MIECFLSNFNLLVNCSFELQEVKTLKEFWLVLCHPYIENNINI